MHFFSSAPVHAESKNVNIDVNYTLHQDGMLEYSCNFITTDSKYLYRGVTSYDPSTLFSQIILDHLKETFPDLQVMVKIRGSGLLKNTNQSLTAVTVEQNHDYRSVRDQIGSLQESFDNMITKHLNPSQKCGVF